MFNKRSASGVGHDHIALCFTDETWTKDLVYLPLRENFGGL